MDTKATSTDEFTVLDLAMLNNFTMYVAEQYNDDLVVPIEKMIKKIDLNSSKGLNAYKAGSEMALYASDPNILNGDYALLVYSGRDNHHLVSIDESLKYMNAFMNIVAVVLGVVDNAGARYYAWSSEDRISRAFFNSDGSEEALIDARNDPESSGLFPLKTDYHYYPIIIQHEEK